MKQLKLALCVCLHSKREMIDFFSFVKIRLKSPSLAGKCCISNLPFHLWSRYKVSSKKILLHMVVISTIQALLYCRSWLWLKSSGCYKKRMFGTKGKKERWKDGRADGQSNLLRYFGLRFLLEGAYHVCLIAPMSSQAKYSEEKGFIKLELKKI